MTFFSIHMQWSWVPDNDIPMSYTAELREGGSLDLNSTFLTRDSNQKQKNQYKIN